jgi:GWxTD domain-containing protein
LRKGEFYIYFNLYSELIDVPVNIRYILKNENKPAAVDTVISSVIDEKITAHILNLKKKRFKKNRYELTIEVDSEKKKVKNKTNFSFFWSQVPSTTEDIDAALKQMTYILNSDSLRKYEDALLEEKQKFFKNFWKQRDPNPATSKNELMDEYFKRVNYANRQFSTFNMSGWLADRGRILIKFGTPDDIERHPFEIDTVPYEIWRYYALRKEFLFQDHSGFGDYRLHPAYLNMEYE